MSEDLPKSGLPKREEADISAGSNIQGPGVWTIISCCLLLPAVSGFLLLFLMVQFGSTGLVLYILCGLATVGFVAYLEKETAEQGKPIFRLVVFGFALSFLVGFTLLSSALSGLNLRGM